MLYTRLQIIYEMEPMKFTHRLRFAVFLLWLGKVYFTVTVQNGFVSGYMSISVLMKDFSQLLVN